MGQYSLRIYRRRRPNETVGILDRKLQLEANDDREADIEGRAKLGEINWETHFAVVMNEDASSVHWWTNKYA